MLDFDLDDVMPRSDAVASEKQKPTEIVRTPNKPSLGELIEEFDKRVEICTCGHPKDAHSGACEILECECPEFTPDAASGAEDEGAVEPSTDASEIPADHCQHMCENPECLKWWSHGPKSSCKYPDLLRQGLCQACTEDGKTYQYSLTKDWKDNKLSAAAQIRMRNDENVVCRDMNSQQLTDHIERLAFMIEELRVKSLQARKNRAEIEEEALKNIPDSEREKFIQELRNGGSKGKSKAKTTKKPKLDTPKSQEAALIVKLKSEGKSNEDAKTIAAMMVKTGKTQAQVEAWLYE